MAESSNSPSADTHIEARSNFDIATYVAARAFNSAAYPPGMPDWLKLAIEARADELREIAKNDFAFDELSEAGAKEKRRKDADETAEAQLGLIMQEQQRERAEWARAPHTLAGQTLTGTEWREVADDLKAGGAGRSWLLAYLMQQGQTREQAEQTAKDMQLAASGMSKPEGDRTTEEKAAVDRVEEDAVTAKAFSHYLEQKEKGFATTDPSLAAQVGGNRDASTQAGADALSDFATAPDLSAHHREALAASRPLDDRSKQQAAAPAPQPAASAGLDI